MLNLIKEEFEDTKEIMKKKKKNQKKKNPKKSKQS